MVLRLQAQRLGDVGDRSQVVLLGPLHPGAVQPGEGQVGLDAHGPVQQLQGFRPALLAIAHLRQPQKRPGPVRLGPGSLRRGAGRLRRGAALIRLPAESRGEAALRPRQVVLLQEQLAAGDERPPVPGLQPQHLVDQRPLGLLLPLQARHQRQVEQHLRVARVLRPQRLQLQAGGGQLPGQHLQPGVQQPLLRPARPLRQRLLVGRERPFGVTGGQPLVEPVVELRPGAGRPLFRSGRGDHRLFARHPGRAAAGQQRQGEEEQGARREEGTARRPAGGQRRNRQRVHGESHYTGGRRFAQG